MATMYLADFGADVVKIEPQAGDRLAADPGYLCWNRNKRFSSVDLEDYHELAELRRMLGVADVAVFDWPPSELDRLGFDATTLLSRHPSLIHLWLRPYSSGGRWSHLPEDPILLAAVSGVADYYRATEERPVAPVVPAVSYTQAGLAAAGVAAALVDRATNGHGRSLVVTGLHAVAAQHAAVTVDAPNIVRSGWQPKDGVALLPNYSPYQCGDGDWLFLGALTQPFFLSALEALGLVEVMVMPGWMVTSKTC
jgi:crotonobetainyl-CoA:carnitine CoA-transferase CaiB-like acyl-CoA transferase